MCSTNEIRRDQNLSKCIIKKLYEMQKSGELCDYKLKTENGGTFKVHKWVLTTVSPFFAKLHNKDKQLNEKNSDTFLVRRVSTSILEKIIEFMYTGETEISIGSAKEIVDIALFLNLYSLAEYGCKMLVKAVNEENCLEWLRYSETCLHYGEELTKKSLKLNCKKFKDFVNLSGFLELSSDTIKLLATQERASYTEDNLFFAVKKWITHNLEERKQFATILFNSIEFNHFTSELKQASIKNYNTNNNDNNDVNVPPILTLNDYCLLHLFTFLSLCEIKKMSDVCERFHAIFERIFKIKKSLDFNEFRHLSLMEVRQIVIKIGYLIENISCRNKYRKQIQTSYFCGRHRRSRPSCVNKHEPNNQQRFIEFLPDFCQNLKVLQLKSVISVHPATFRRIGLNLKLIKTLELIDCDINDRICLHLSELQNIEILNLSQNNSLTGKHLYKFTKLKQLSLNDCRKIQAAHFIKLCLVNLTTLKELHISYCGIFCENTYKSMATILINLETLTISTNDQVTKLTKLADLKYLKNLAIHSDSVMKDDLFINLSNKTEHTLEKLSILNGSLNNKKKSIITSIKTIKDLRIALDPDIDDEFLSKCSKCSLECLCVYDCENITKNGIIELLKRSDSLKVLNISFCYQFDNDFIYKVFDVLKMKGRSEPYKMIVGHTNITSSILKDPKYIEHRKYVELSFNEEFGFD